MTTADEVIAMQSVPVARTMAAYVFSRSGRQKEARDLLQQLEAAAEKRFVCFFNIATVFAALGEKDRAFAALERAYRDRTG